MATQTDGIYTEVSVDTSGLADALKTVQSTVDKIESELGSVGTAADSAGNSAAEMGAKFKSASAGVGELSKTLNSVSMASSAAVQASKNITSALEAQRAGVANYIEKLREENNTLGMNAQELAEYTAKKLGASEADKKVISNLVSQIEAFRKNTQAIADNAAAADAAAAKQQAQRDNIAQMVKQLEFQAATLGKTTRQIILYKAAQEGATTAEKKSIIQSLNAIEAYERKVEATRKATFELNKTSEAVGKATGSFGGLRGAAQNLGWQLQDTAVQLQMGTNGFVVLSQQGSQLASSLGPGGAVFAAVIAIAGAIGGVLYQSLQKVKGPIKELPEDLKKQLEEIKAKYSEIDDVSKAAFTQVSLGKVGYQYEKQLALVRKLESQLKSYAESARSGSESAAFSAAKIADKLKDANVRLRELGAYQDQLNQFLAEGAASGAEGYKEQADAAQQLVQQLQLATVKLNEGDAAAIRLSAAMSLGLKAGEALPPEVEKAVAALIRAEEVQKRIAETKRQELETQKQLNSEIEREMQAELAMLNEKDKQKQKVTTEFQSVQTAITSDLETPAQRAERELAERQAVIQKYGEQEKLHQDQIDSYKLLAAQATEKKITEIKKQEESARRQLMQTALGSIGDLFGNLADIAKEGGEKSFKTWKMMASAQAAINAALAVTNVLATVPAPFNIPLAASVAALAAVNIAKIQGQQYGGGRMYGGSVSAGKMYRVGEGGKPEIYQQGNRNYLVPGDGGGKVVSNKDAFGGGGSVNMEVNVHNYGQDRVNVSRRREGASNKEIVDIVVGDINNRGPIHSAITRTTTAGNRTS